MSNTDRPPSTLPLRPPTSLIIVAFALLLGGLFTSPELLIKLGPMRGSLTHANELVRNTTLMEVMIFRLGSIGLSLVLLGIILAWKRLIQSPIVARIANHQQLDSPRLKGRGSFFNVSFVVMLASVVLGLLYVALGDQVFDHSIRDLVNGEEGLVEQATALVFLMSSILSAVMVFKVAGNRSRTVVYACFAVLFFLCFGEEISWGQRIFDLETIGFIKDINVQGENNIHNLFGYFADRLFFVGVFVYGVICPYLKATHRFWRQLFDMIGLPLPSPGLALGFLVVSLLHDWSVYRVFSPSMGLSFREFRELLTGVGFLLLMYECWVSMRGERSTGWAKAIGAPAART